MSNYEKNPQPELTDASKSNQWNGMYVVRHTAKLIKDSINNGNCPLLPGADGKVKTVVLYNARTGYIPDAKDLIPLAIERQNRGFRNSVIASWTSLKEAGTRLKEGEKGIPYTFKDKEGNYRGSQHFFAEQTENPEKFLDKAAKCQNLYLKGQTLKIDSAENYLPVYIAACKGGAEIEVDPKVVEQFKENLSKICENEVKPHGKDVEMQSLSSLLNNANSKAVIILSGKMKELQVGKYSPEKIKAQEEKKQARAANQKKKPRENER